MKMRCQNAKLFLRRPLGFARTMCPQIDSPEVAGAPFLDMTGEFQKYPKGLYLLPRDAHLNQKGSDVVAEQLAQHLVPILDSPDSAKPESKAMEPSDCS